MRVERRIGILRSKAPRSPWLGVITLVALATLIPILGSIAGTIAGTVRVSAAPPESTQTSPAVLTASPYSVAPCGELRPADEPSSPTIALKPRVVLASIRPDAMVSFDSGLVVVDGAGSKMVGLSTDGSVRWSYATNIDSSAGYVGSLAVDPSGSAYRVKYPNEVRKLSPTGQTLWTASFSSPIARIFGTVVQGTWRVVVVTSTSTRVLSMAGADVGSAPVSGLRFTPTGDGGLLVGDGNYVRKYRPSFLPQSVFGSPYKDNDPMSEGAPLHFYQQGDAVELPDGRILVGDGGWGFWLVNSRGLVLGLVPTDELGGLTEEPKLVVIGSELFYSAGRKFTNDQKVLALPISDIVARAVQPKAGAARLGFGAGLVTPAAGNYFAPGSTPSVELELDAWWGSIGAVTLQYTVRRSSEVEADAPAITRSMPIAPGARQALALPPPIPGAYEVDARLLVDGTAVGATCLHYTIGAPGHALNMAALPPGADAGGPSGPRGVALADELGTGSHRISLHWNRLLDPAGLTTFDNYDAEIKAAAAESARRGVPFSVQLGEGGVERSFVDNGTWEARTREVVAHWAPYVDYWEAWNEPNITFGSAAAYVDQVLVPFRRAVRAADPGAKVIGGSPVGMSIQYFREIGQAGGFNSMDIVAIHPYTGHNRSWEEEGVPGQIQELKAILTSNGKSAMPIWITEFAFWSNGPANWFAQADKSARVVIWNKALANGVWQYFLSEGSWGNYGVTFSAIETGGPVKPAALALMETKNQLTGRTFSGWITTNIPHTYGARFGPAPGGNDQVVVFWADDASLDGTLTTDRTLDATLTDQYGASEPLPLSQTETKLTFRSSVQYVRLPADAALSVSARSAWGKNLAATAAGGVAIASSSGPWNPPSAAIDGIADARGVGEFPGSPAWASAVGDPLPTLTVTLSPSASVNTVWFSTAGLGSVLSGVRDIDVEVQASDGTWVYVGGVRDLFFDRATVVTFPARTAKAVRLKVLRVNFSGYAGGAKPWFWPAPGSPDLVNPGYALYGPAIIRELEVYAATTTGPAPTTTTSSSSTTTTFGTSTTTSLVPPSTTSSTVAPATSTSVLTVPGIVSTIEPTSTVAPSVATSSVPSTASTSLAPSSSTSAPPTTTTAPSASTTTTTTPTTTTTTPTTTTPTTTTTTTTAPATTTTTPPTTTAPTTTVPVFVYTPPPGQTSVRLPPLSPPEPVGNPAPATSTSTPTTTTTIPQTLVFATGRTDLIVTSTENAAGVTSAVPTSTTAKRRTATTIPSLLPLVPARKESASKPPTRKASPTTKAPKGARKVAETSSRAASRKVVRQTTRTTSRSTTRVSTPNR